MIGLRIADCELRIEEDLTAASQPAIPGGRFGIDNPQSAIRNPQYER